MPNHPVDKYVGNRMRQRRTLLGMSQEKLGTAVGLTFQQIQKYERGSNRIGSSRLYEFAKVLDVPVAYFFDEMPAATRKAPGQTAPRRGSNVVNLREQATPFEQEKDPLIKRETLELVRAYYKIREPRVRKRIFEMVKAVGAASHAEVLGGRHFRSSSTTTSSTTSSRSGHSSRTSRQPRNDNAERQHHRTGTRG